MSSTDLSCGINSAKMSIQNKHFSTAVRVHCHPTRQEFCKKVTPFSSQKAIVMVFPADGTILNFFFLGDCVWCHWVNWYLDLDVSWWAQVLSSMTFYSRKQLLSLLLCSCQHSLHPVSTDLGIAELGPPLWTHIKVALDGMAPCDIPNEEETLECAVSW
jgi:hypothetical protein